MEQLVVPVSALEHYSYCVRQCALIHVEQVFDDNVHTVRGHLAHERVDRGDRTLDEGVRVLRGVPIWSDRYGLRGRADVIELRPDAPYPIEYKVGPWKAAHADLQVCAQALCLEEMFDTPVPKGAVFHRARGYRREVRFTEDLRSRTLQAVIEIRGMLRTLTVPPPRNDARCPNCSLVEICLPSVVGEPDRLRGLQGSLFIPLGPPTHA